MNFNRSFPDAGGCRARFQLLRLCNFVLQVTYVKGYGSLKSPTEVEVTGLDGTTSTVSGKNIIIATGSEVTPLPGITIDEKRCAEY